MQSRMDVEHRDSIRDHGLPGCVVVFSTSIILDRNNGAQAMREWCACVFLLLQGCLWLSTRPPSLELRN